MLLSLIRDDVKIVAIYFERMNVAQTTQRRKLRLKPWYKSRLNWVLVTSFVNKTRVKTRESLK